MKNKCPLCNAEMKYVEEGYYVCLLCGYSSEDTSEDTEPDYIG